jgi:hypothetical protein
MDTIQAYWQTMLDEVAVNGTNISMPVANKRVVIESGLSQVFGPHGVIVEFYANIPGSAPIESSYGQYTCTLSLR